ncbi:MAG: SIMPL domain-containing protein, partial [Acidobacteriaceae bacterium]
MNSIELNSVQVTAQGKFEAEPDTAVITLTLSDKQPQQDRAYKNVSDAAQRLRDILQQNNVDPKQARVSSYSINPEYDWTNAKRKLLGYTVATTATLKLKDFVLANKLLSQFSDLPYASNQNLSYILEDMNAAKQKAIADGYNNARLYAETVAQSSGRRLGELLHATVDTQTQIRPVMYARSAAPLAAEAHAAPPSPAADLGQETTTITAQVNAIFRLQ